MIASPMISQRRLGKYLRRMTPPEREVPEHHRGVHEKCGWKCDEGILAVITVQYFTVPQFGPITNEEICFHQRENMGELAVTGRRAMALLSALPQGQELFLPRRL